MIREDIVPLTTERLVLRLVEGSDAAAMHRFRSDPAATRYILSSTPLWPTSWLMFRLMFRLDRPQRLSD